MSRLWPERRALALFPEHAWLSIGQQLLTAAEASAAPGDWFGAADALLQRSPHRAVLRPRLDVLLSDEAAQAIALPWQDGLRTHAQQLRYAEACLEDAGVRADGWSTQLAYRHYGCAGMAFAVKTATLEQLSALATAHRLRLGSVLPAAVAAYWRHSLARKSETLVILAEARRFTALRFAARALVALDVQPVLGSADAALQRLLRRVQLQAGDIAAVHHWSAAGPAPIEPLVAECFPAARFHLIPQGSLL